ncbi:hypothetical protein QYE76_045811 [Lolium multiflorum]|uniref:Uncharacterized protein n=1 Tax=Lolium multiflorum TaxID=4521 RepID=A0AAD8X0H5_LOLMU|nr:hypothetical protein QYE76_045811 [Lolium multiflorum]
MANDGANNGFDRRSSSRMGGTAPPHGATRRRRLRAGRMETKRGGVPIPPPPMVGTPWTPRSAQCRHIHRRAARSRASSPTRTAVDRVLPKVRELAASDGPPPPARNNAAGRRRWWSVHGRTLPNVLAHIEDENFPVLEMPPPEAATLSRRRGSSWMPRRMAPSSSSSGSRSASRSGGSTGGSQNEPASPSTPAIKKEPTSPPPARGRSSGALVIRNQPSSLQRGRKRKSAKKEAPRRPPTGSPEERRAGGRRGGEAIAVSLKDLVPADNSLPIDAALEWSRATGARGCERSGVADPAAARNSRSRRRTRRRNAAPRRGQARGEQRRRHLPAVTATRRRCWPGYEPLVRGAVAPGRRRLERRR